MMSLTNNGGIRPYFDYPVKDDLLRQPEPHPRLQRLKLDEFRGGMMQLIGRPQVPLER